ncbi:MAG TPA: hypothetical protein VIQ30_02375 [Pseudonocardia sp.]
MPHTADDDLIGHERSEACPCGPDVQLVRHEGEPDVWLVVHHSLDGRERSEPRG